MTRAGVRVQVEQDQNNMEIRVQDKEQRYMCMRTEQRRGNRNFKRYNLMSSH